MLYFSHMKALTGFKINCSIFCFYYSPEPVLAADSA